MCDHDHKENNFFPGLVLGALIGVGASYFLLSTERGKKIRKQIEKKGEETLDSLADFVEEFEEKGNEFRQRAMEIKAELEEKAEDFEGEVLDEAKDQLEKIEELEDRGRKVAQKVFTRNGKPLV